LLTLHQKKIPNPNRPGRELEFGDQLLRDSESLVLQLALNAIEIIDTIVSVTVTIDALLVT
jgi:hypothetical protein